MNSKFTNKAQLLRSQRSLHNTLLWWGAGCVLIWALSGLTHPLMSWFGPKQANYRPPAMTMNLSQADNQVQAVSLNELNQLARRLINEGVDNVSIAKVVPSKLGPMLQLTSDQTEPRRYFPLTGNTAERFLDSELHGFDDTQARWLASYYTGRDSNEIAEVVFQTEFDGDYPWVNRLLPVYKIRFQGEDALTAYVHTESSQLAGLANTTRLQLQWLFRTFHTFDFLDDQNTLRVSTLFLAMLVLLGMAISGLGLVLLIRHRKIKQASRRWHRRLGYAMWLPLLAWSVSGGYHLIQSAYVDLPSGIRLNTAFNFARFEPNAQSVEVDQEMLAQWSGRSLLAASLLNLEGQLVYRLSLASSASKALEPTEKGSAHQHHHQQVKKFRGAPSEKESLYLDALTMAPMAISDKGRAAPLALAFSGLAEDQVLTVEPVTHFGPDYDFRNKRLPVWKVSFDDNQERQLFVDPSISMLVDQTRAIDRAERWSFSVLHKWNHLIPFTGRFNRDVLIVITLAFLTLLTLIGGWMAWKRLFVKH